MRNHKAVAAGLLGILVFCVLVKGYAAPLEANTKMRRVSGVIESIDVKRGTLQLKSDTGQHARGIMEYTINQNETRVTDPTDKKFIVIKDLRAGQHVTLELVDGPNETAVRKIVADPMPEPVFQSATGALEAIDFQAGTLVIDDKGDLTYFVFEPKEVVSNKELKPADLVKVDFMVKDGKRHARSIMLLQAAPEDATSTTTTTTTSTTVIQ